MPPNAAETKSTWTRMRVFRDVKSVRVSRNGSWWTCHSSPQLDGVAQQVWCERPPAALRAALPLKRGRILCPPLEGVAHTLLQRFFNKGVVVGLLQIDFGLGDTCVYEQ